MQKYKGLDAMLRRNTPAQLKNLEKRNTPKSSTGERRTVYASTRVTPSAKENLTAMLDGMNLSLADFLEKVAHGEIEIIEKN